MDNTNMENLMNDEELTEEEKAKTGQYKALFAQMDNPKSILSACSKRLRELKTPHFIVIENGNKAQPFYYEAALPMEFGNMNKLDNAFFFEYLQHKLLTMSQYKKAQSGDFTTLNADPYIVGLKNQGKDEQVVLDIKSMLAGLEDENIYSILAAVLMTVGKNQSNK